MDKKYLTLTLILALCGFIISILLAKLGINILSDINYKSICNFNESFNCETVALSKYSFHFGIPNFIYGIIYYFLLFALSVYNIFPKKPLIPNFFVYLFWVSLVSVLISVYLFLVSHFVIHSFCIFCIMIYVVNILLFLVAFMAENWSINRLVSTLSTDLKWYFSSRVRVVIFAGLIALLIVTLFYYNAHPLFGETPDNNTTPPIKFNYSETSPDRLVTGTPNLPTITIMMFTDYECNFCGNTSLEIKKLLNANPDLRLVYKDYPLDNSCNPRLDKPFHHYSCSASIHARCAAEQGKFWEYHDLLFQNQSKLDSNSLQQHAQALELNMDQFNDCVQNKKPLARIMNDIDEAAALNVSGTPTLFFEGRKVEGYKTVEEYQKIVDEIKLEIKKEKEKYEKEKEEYLKKKAQEEAKNTKQNPESSDK